ncbi:unnamed protein product [Caretta caretta]
MPCPGFLQDAEEVPKGPSKPIRVWEETKLPPGNNVKPPLWGMEQSNLLATCFSSIFSLPPAQTIQGMEAALNTKTLKAMDEMLKALACEDQKSNLVVLQNILEVWRRGGRKGTRPVAGVGLGNQGSI